MEGDRYCERIGRPHKSNHVMMVVELGARVVYQSCWDPDCRGYHSPARTPPARRWGLGCVAPITSTMVVRAGPVPEEALTEAEAARMCGLPVPQPSAEELLGDDALTDEAVSTSNSWPGQCLALSG